MVKGLRALDEGVALEDFDELVERRRRRHRILGITDRLPAAAAW